MYAERRRVFQGSEWVHEALVFLQGQAMNKVWFCGNCGEEGYKNPTQALLCPLCPLYFSMIPQVQCTGKAMCISHILIKMKFGKKPEVGRVNSSLWIVFLYSQEEKYAKSGRSTVFFINILPEFLNYLFRGNTTGPP